MQLVLRGNVRPDEELSCSCLEYLDPLTIQINDATSRKGIAVYIEGYRAGEAKGAKNGRGDAI